MSFCLYASTNLPIVFIAASCVYEQQQTVNTQRKSIRQSSLTSATTELDISNNTHSVKIVMSAVSFYSIMNVTEVREIGWLR